MILETLRLGFATLGGTLLAAGIGNGWTLAAVLLLGAVALGWDIRRTRRAKP